MKRDPEKIYAEGRLMTGGSAIIRKDAAVGFCHYPEHKGIITKNSFKNRGCSDKNCRYFEKYAENPYWEQLALRKVALQQKKERAKESKKKRETQERELMETAIRTARELEHDIRIKRIQKTPGKKHYVLFYLSKRPFNDWYYFFDLAKALGWIWGGMVELRHIKGLDGRYATG